MKRSIVLAAMTSLAVFGCALRSPSQPPPPPEALMDLATNLVIQKFQNSSCEDLSQMQSQPQSQPQAGPQAALQEKAIKMLRNNPEMRTEFINRVAGPIANRMFDCGLIP